MAASRRATGSRSKLFVSWHIDPTDTIQTLSKQVEEISDGLMYYNLVWVENYGVERLKAKVKLDYSK